MKRVLLVTSFFRPEPGGLEGLFAGLARRWEPRLLHVLVTAAPDTNLRDATERYRFDKDEPYTIERFAPRTDLMGVDNVFLQRVEELLEKFVPEHIVFCDMGRVARLIAGVATGRARAYSVFLNGADLKNNLGFFRWRERRFVLRAKNVFTLSQSMAAGARDFGIPEERICALPPGLDVNVRPARASKLPKEWLADSRGKTIFFASGPFLPRKGLDVVVEAVALLPAPMRRRMYVFLAGSGPDFTYVEELIRIRGLADTMTMTGFISDEWYHALLRRSDVFVQPGREREDDSTGLGMALMEAAHHGLPCIVGKLGGTPERVRDGVSGYLIPPGDPEALSQKMAEMLEHPRSITRLGRNASEIAGREYDLGRAFSTVRTRL